MYIIIILNVNGWDDKNPATNPSYTTQLRNNNNNNNRTKNGLTNC